VTEGCFVVRCKEIYEEFGLMLVWVTVRPICEYDIGVIMKKRII